MVGAEGLAKRKGPKEFVSGMYVQRNNTTHGGSADLTDADTAGLTGVSGRSFKCLHGYNRACR